MGPAYGQVKRYNDYTNEIEIESILVVKLDHIGDFILALDLFAALRRAFPSAKLTLLCGPGTLRWRAQREFSNVSRRWIFSLRPPMRSGRIFPANDGEIAETPFDLAIDLRVDPETRVVLDHLSAKYKCGYVSGAV